MKSKRAQQYLDGQYPLEGRDTHPARIVVIKAVELAEADARERAVNAYIMACERRASCQDLIKQALGTGGKECEECTRTKIFLSYYDNEQ